MIPEEELRKAILNILARLFRSLESEMLRLCDGGDLPAKIAECEESRAHNQGCWIDDFFDALEKWK